MKRITIRAIATTEHTVPDDLVEDWTDEAVVIQAVNDYDYENGHMPMSDVDTEIWCIENDAD